MKRLLIFLIILLISFAYSDAQASQWCEIVEADIDRGNPSQVWDELRQHLEAVENFSWASFVTGRLSRDGLVAAIVISDGNYANQSILIIDTVNDAALHYFPVETIQALHPYEGDPDNTPDGITIRDIIAIPQSHNFGIVTELYYRNSGEWQPPPDNIHILEYGNIETLLPPREGGQVAFSPDGRYLAVATTEQLILMRTDGTMRRDHALSVYRADFPSGYNFFIPKMRWENDESFLVFLHPLPEADSPNGLMEAWRVFVDEREPEFVASYAAFFPTFNIASGGQYVSYARFDPEESASYGVIATIAGEEVFVVPIRPDYNWLFFVY